MKLCELNNMSKIESERYNIWFSDKPFKSLSVSLKNSDIQNLFSFTVNEGENRWICGMTKTSYFQSYVYERCFDPDTDIELILYYIDGILRHFKAVLYKAFDLPKI
jgi:hypothetical protein